MADPIQSEASLVERILEPPALPSSVRAIARDHVIDFVGVALAGIGSEPVRLLESLVPPRKKQSAGDARAWTRGWLPARDAALLNAVAGHFHDFDDDEAEYSISHPTVAILPAAVAAADLAPISGARLIEAYVTAVELVMRIGLLVNPAHYLRGFHSTSTLGVVGAAAASGVVLGLDADRMRNAIGIAASLASGIRSNFGSNTKCLQVGNAARNGLMAAELAARGFTSTRSSLFGPLGFVKVYDGHFEDIHSSFGSPWLIVDPGITIKAYPCCTDTHTALDSLFALMAERPIAPEQVAGVYVEVDDSVPGVLIHNCPTTALEGKFSMPFCIAAGLLRGRLSITEFDDEFLRDPRIQELMAKVTMEPSRDLPKGLGGFSLASRLRLTLRDGTVLESYTERPSGSSTRRLSAAALEAKFFANAAATVDEARAARVLRALREIDQVADVSQAFDCLSLDVRQEPL